MVNPVNAEDSYLYYPQTQLSEFILSYKVFCSIQNKYNLLKRIQGHKRKKNKKTKTYKLYTVTNRSLDIIFKERKYFHIFNIFLVIIIVDFQKTQSYLGSSSQVIITFYNWLTNGMITIKKKSLSQRCVTQRICLRTNNLFSILQRDWDYRSTADSSEYFNKV